MTGPLVIDGQEDAQGRALFAISALHLCADALRSVPVVIADVSSPSVQVAAEALAWDEGLSVAWHPPEQSGRVLDEACFYAAVAFGDVTHLRLDEAARRGVSALVAIQFPSRGALARWPSALTREAHDTRAFAACLLDALGARHG